MEDEQELSIRRESEVYGFVHVQVRLSALADEEVVKLRFVSSVRQVDYWYVERFSGGAREVIRQTGRFTKSSHRLRRVLENAVYHSVGYRPREQGFHLPVDVYYLTLTAVSARHKRLK